MRLKRSIAAITIIILTVGSVTYGQDNKNQVKYNAGVLLGYNRGFGVQTNFTAFNFSPAFRTKLRLGIGLTFLNPGNAADARRIFINDATNGVPEKNGNSFDFRFDFMFPKSVFGHSNSYIVLGPRFSTFRGHFDYVDGNEVFDVTSTQWGAGLGIEHRFRMTDKLSLSLAYGVDFYFPSTLTGHDTSYSPDNDNVNPEEDNQRDYIPFEYRDANKAIRQPELMPRFMLGINLDL
jgi:hypothetical protein